MDGKSKEQAVDLTDQEDTPPGKKARIEAVTHNVTHTEEPPVFAIHPRNMWKVDGEDKVFLADSLRSIDQYGLEIRSMDTREENNGEDDDIDREESLFAVASRPISDDVFFKVMGTNPARIEGRYIVGAQHCLFRGGYPVPSVDGLFENTGPVLWLDDGGMLFALTTKGVPSNIWSTCGEDCGRFSWNVGFPSGSSEES